VADVLRSLILETPPNIGGGIHDLFRAWKAGRTLNALPLQAKRDVLDLFTISAAEWLDRWFESAPIKACFGFDAVVGNFASPYAAGSAYVLLHHVFGEVNGKKGSWGHASAAWVPSLRRCAARPRRAGWRSEPGRAWRACSRARGRALGVVLDNGDEIAARCVVSNAHPRALLRLLSDVPGAWREPFEHLPERVGDACA
jgi:phytoene dehydrogenase-like protein